MVLTQLTPAAVDKVLAETARLQKENRRLRAQIERDRAARERDRAERAQARDERDAAEHERDAARCDLFDILDHRFIIEQAKGVIAAQRGLGMDEAFVALRAAARQNNQTIGDVCRLVVNAMETAAARRRRSNA